MSIWFLTLALHIQVVIMKDIFNRALLSASIMALGACGGSGGGGLPEANSSSTATSSISSSMQSSSAAPVFQSNFALGADLSWASEMEANGYTFFDTAGTPTDIFTLMSSLGVNAIRLRVWVNPADGWYNSSQDVITKAKRAKAQGQRIMIDFHYSDNWADPGKQTKPAAWASYSVAELQTALADHTRETLIALRDEGITPEWVQVGNETNDGFLWDDARPSTEPRASTMKNYADLTSAGYDAVKEIFPQALVIVHLANCHDNANFRWIFDGLTANGGKFDVIGASSYPLANTGTPWRTVNNNCLANMNDMVNRYQAPVMLTEIGLPWDHPDAKAVVTDLIEKVAAVQEGRGLGVFYWEPQAHNGWRGYTLGAFDDTGKPAAGMMAIQEAANKIPTSTAAN